jgi:hypothetical protein
MGSVATQGEGAQNLLCAYMAAALLAGLAGNALLGLWWLDPTAALAIAALAVREGIQAWQGESCCIPTASTETHACADDHCTPSASNGHTEACCAPGAGSEPRRIAQCHLDLAAAREQADRYRRLGATATHIECRGDALTTTFGDQLDEQLLKETIAVEGDCCPFFDFAYQPAERRLSITVQQPDQRPTLDALHHALTGTEAQAPTGAR